MTESKSEMKRVNKLKGLPMTQGIAPVVQQSKHTRKVVCAACKHGDVIICGARHFDKVMHSQLDAMKESKKPPGSWWEQGFTILTVGG